MVANYRGIWVLWLALCLLAVTGPARSDTVRVGDLSLAVDSSWHRAGPVPEGNSGNWTLTRSEYGARLQVFLPGRPIQLATAPEAFFRQMDRGWQASYGSQATVTWQEIGGRRWRVCRRPSLDGSSTVFQLVTVWQDAAYQVMVMAPGGMASLPGSVVRLLGGRWGDDSQAVVSAYSGGLWHLMREIAVRPGPAQWDGIAASIQPRLGRYVWLSGLGLKVGTGSLDWFLEGKAVAKSRELKPAAPVFQAHWQVAWQPHNDNWREGENLVVDLDFADQSESGRSNGGFGVRYELFAACAPVDRLHASLEALEAGRQTLDAALDMLGAGCQGDVAGPPPVTVMAGGEKPAAGASWTSQALIPLPADWAEALRPRDGQSDRRLLLLMRFVASQGGSEPGDALLNRAAVVFVFAPAS